MSVMKRKFK